MQIETFFHILKNIYLSLEFLFLHWSTESNFLMKRVTSTLQLHVEEYAYSKHGTVCTSRKKERSEIKIAKKIKTHFLAFLGSIDDVQLEALKCDCCG